MKNFKELLKQGYLLLKYIHLLRYIILELQVIVQLQRFSKCSISWNFISSISSNIISSSFGPSTPVQSASAAPAGLQSSPGGMSDVEVL